MVGRGVRASPYASKLSLLLGAAAAAPLTCKNPHHRPRPFSSAASNSSSPPGTPSPCTLAKLTYPFIARHCAAAVRASNSAGGVGGGVSKTATLSVEVGETEPPAPEGSVAGAYVFYCPAGATRCVVSPETSVVITEDGPSAPYTLRDVPPGTYQVFAWKDLNGSGQRDSDEPFGSYPSLEAPAAVTPPADGIDVTIIPALGTQTPGTQGQGPTVTVSPEANFAP